MITHQREKYNWQFLFLAANQDAIATAAHMGIAGHLSSAVRYSQGGIHSSSSSLSRKLSAMRYFYSTGEKTPDYDAPMEDIVKDEESKKENE